MTNQRKRIFLFKNQRDREKIIIPLLVIVTIALIVLLAYMLQIRAEQGAFTKTETMGTPQAKDQYELFKLAAEIRQIRSDTSGSLFWLKLVALFVTVGGAVGGYLLGQSRVTRRKIEFEQRKNVDQVYQAIIQELSDNKPLLRAAAAVKLGALLKAIPTEWNLDDENRKMEIIQLTKRVLAASLAIEQDGKVLKTITIELARHKPWADNAGEKNKAKLADIREIDLSGAKAADAYWARVDFSYTDFYAADLQGASFRESILIKSQFRGSNLQKAIFTDSNCEEANFKMADLRNTDFTGANLIKANFENAKVNGINLSNAKIGSNPDVKVDDTPEGNGIDLVSFDKWYAKTKSY